MIFLLIGAPLVFLVGLLIGMSVCLLTVILLVSYASGIPLTSPMHVCVAIYLVLGKAWHRLTSSSPRLSIETIRNSLDMDKFTTLPYVRVLPMTTPSKEAQFWGSLLVKEKENTFLAEIRKPYSSSRVAMLRRNVAFSEPMFTLYDRSLTTITRSTIVDGDNHEIPLHWVQYSGADISAGVILCIHGGGYVAGMPSMQYSLCAELSKLTGAVCVSVDYRLCPDHGATITDALSDCFETYRHLVLTEKVAPSKICVVGESAGGGLSLLLLQKIRDHDLTSTRKADTDADAADGPDADSRTGDKVRLGQPACCWVNSPWTDLAMDSASVARNDSADGMLANDPQRYFQRMAVGEIDINLKKRYKSEESKPSLKSPEFSPLFADWDGLCPIYFMVGATEMLLDDTLRAAKKAFEAGTKVAVDVAPYMHHTWPLFLRTLPEAKYAVLRASDFILRQFKVASTAAQ